MENNLHDRKDINPIDSEHSASINGDKNNYIYFNLQYTGARVDSTIISLALVDAYGRSFYAEFTDYNMRQVDSWVLENVLKNLTEPVDNFDGDHWTMCGKRIDVRRQIYFWLDKYVREGRTVQFVGDVSYLGYVLLFDLLREPDKSFYELPSWISPATVDINQDIAGKLTSIEKFVSSMTDNKNYIPVRQAFDISRIDLCKALNPDADMTGIHYNNALHQTYLIKTIHQFLWGMYSN